MVGRLLLQRPVHFGSPVRRIGVIGGVGFLGAGAVIQSGGAVKGLTTAASIWVTAAIGISCGLGLYRLAAICTAVAMFTLVVLGLLEKQANQTGSSRRDGDEPSSDRNGDGDGAKGRDAGQQD